MDINTRANEVIATIPTKHTQRGAAAGVGAAIGATAGSLLGGPIGAALGGAAGAALGALIGEKLRAPEDSVFMPRPAAARKPMVS